MEADDVEFDVERLMEELPTAPVERLRAAEQLKEKIQERLNDTKRRLRESEKALNQAELNAEVSKLRSERAEVDLARAEKRVEQIATRSAHLVTFAFDGSKSLGLLNSAAAAAMLALTQSLVANGNFPAIKAFVLSSLMLFLVGAFFASVVGLPSIRVLVSLTSDVLLNDWRTRVSTAMFTWLPRLSALAFFSGATVLAAGLWMKL